MKVKKMTLSRRDFLKALGVTVAASTVGLPATVASAPVTGIPFDDGILDALVTKKTPFAWIEIDGKRYAAKYVMMDYSAPHQYFPTFGLSADVTLYDYIPHEYLFSSYDSHPVVISIYNRVIAAGEGYVQRAIMSMSHTGEIEQDIVLVLPRLEIATA